MFENIEQTLTAALLSYIYSDKKNKDSKVTYTRGVTLQQA